MTEHTEPGIRIAREGNVGVVIIDNPRRRNAMSRAMRLAFRDSVYGLLNREDEIRALVVTGAGGQFSAGADLSELGRRTITRSREVLRESCEVIRLMASGRKPVVAAVEGVAFGAGLSIACAADFVVASRDARFCAAFLRVGLIPDTGILWTLPQKVGRAKARELLALATEFGAEEAARIGLVSHLAEPGEALAKAVQLAGALARQPPMGMALIKAALTHGNDSLDASLDTEVDYQAVLRQSRDHLEAARAFVEKREPHFSGQ